MESLESRGRGCTGSVQAVGRWKEEETLPSLGVTALRKAAMAFEATTGVGVGGFHPRVLLDLSDEYCQKYLRFCIRWKWRGVTNEREHHSTFFIPKSTTGERPIALLPTLIRWWEWLRPCAKVVGGAESASSESLLVIEACLI